MKNLVFVFITISCFCFSCKKLGFCKDQELGFDRVENNLDALRIGGYYYGDLIGSNPDNPGIYIFYQNGTFYYDVQRPLEDAQNGEIDLGGQDARLNAKTGWGVYMISGNNLEIQSWLPSKNCHEVQVEKGVIENDSVFVITQFYSTDDDEVKMVDAEFRFVPYFPKPDSVVSFIP